MVDGLSREAATAQAEREFGNRRHIRDACQHIRETASSHRRRRERWSGLTQDTRYALRGMARAPLFSLAAITILTLGVGLTTTMFAVMHGVLLKPLPYPGAHELHRLFAVNVEKDVDDAAMSAGDFFALRGGLGGEATIGGYMSWPVSLTGVPEPERLEGALISADLLTTLGVAPAEGRGFLLDEEEPGRDVVLISTRLAARLGLGGRAAGATINLNDRPATIVGVLPASFQFPEPDTDVWIPLALAAADRNNHGSRWLHTIVRFAAGTRPATEDRLQGVMARRDAEHAESNAGWRVRAVPLHDVVVGPAGATLRAMGASLAGVLLVMLVNLVTLVTGRWQRRRDELAIHQALGASRGRVARQLAAEGALLALAGGTLGLLLANGLAGAFRRLADTSVPRAAEVTLSPWVIAFGAAIALLGLAAMSVVPAGRVSAGAAGAVNPHARGTSGRHRPSRVLVVAQTAVATLLVACAALLAQSFTRLSQVDLGFAPDRVLTMRVSLPRGTPEARQRQYFDEVLERLRALPAVASAGAMSDLPLSGNSPNVPIAVFEAATPPAAGEEPRADFRVATPGYFETVRTPVRGRTFAAGDAAGGPPVAIVNDALARRHWPTRDALGMRIRTSADQDWRTIVGVAANVHHGAIAEAEGPAIYVPHAQKAEAWMTWMSMAIRTPGDPRDLIAPVRTTLAGVTPNLPVSGIRTLDDLVADALARPRLAAGVSTVAAAGALVLAALGIGAVLSLLVAARTPELAVRLALGARPGRLAWMPVSEALTLVGIGCAVGLVLAGAGGRMLGALLYGVSPYDVLTFGATAVVLLAIGALAALGPARAVLRIDPTLMLRR
jgi:putative ABC transport system permease protein